MHRRRDTRVLVLAAAFVLALGWASVALADVPVTSIAGADRYATAVAISKASHPATAPAVVVASGDAWADALGGSALAGAVDGPVLLSARGGLPGSVAAELRRLAPSRVFLLGGTASLSEGVEAGIAAALPTAELVRIAGDDRYAVAKAVAEQVVEERGSAPERVFVVTGRTFPDALACAAPAADGGWPILLADPARPERVAGVAKSIDASVAVIVGGTASVPAAVETALDAAFGGPAVTRIAARDRYAVAMAVADWAAKATPLDPDTPVIASGIVPGDALAAGPYAAEKDSVLLLASSAGLPDRLAADFFERRDEIERFTFIGGSRTMPAWVRTEAQYALRARTFSAGRAMEHVRALTDLGVRSAGSTSEKKAADYVAAQLSSFGYAVSTQRVSIPNGRYSTNVIAERPGTAPGVIVIGGHIDSKWPSPGGNDNASGVAVTLELARCLADAEGLVPTIRFIGFGAEEISGSSPEDHHFGSRHYVRSLTRAERAQIQGMVSIDMVGYGSVFNIRNLKVAPMTVVGSLQSWGKANGEPLTYLQDPSRYGWSDHDAFEFAGIPVAWLEWRTDPKYHTRGDTYGHVSSDRVDRTGRVMRGWLLDTTAGELDVLR